MSWRDLRKIEVAKSQLETAIELFFKNGDSVSIHTLACAAHEILEVLCKKKGIASFHLEMMGRIPEIKRDLVRNKLAEAKNFFKHGKRDPNATLKFNPKTTEFVLWDACSLYRKYTGEFGKQRELFLFEVWFVLKNKDAFPQIEGNVSGLDKIQSDIEDKGVFYQHASLALDALSGEIYT